MLLRDDGVEELRELVAVTKGRVFSPMGTWSTSAAVTACTPRVPKTLRTTLLRGPGPLPSTRTLLGYMLVGWGAFNVVEGIIDHHLLELHHVRDLPTHVAFYDWAFLI